MSDINATVDKLRAQQDVLYDSIVDLLEASKAAHPENSAVDELAVQTGTIGMLVYEFAYAVFQSNPSIVLKFREHITDMFDTGVVEAVADLVSPDE